MKKKIISALLCVAMVATVAVGCGKSSDSKSTDSASSSDSSSLVMPVSATVTSLNGDLETMAEGAFQLAPYQDKLYYVDQDETRWYLADSCEVSEDGLEYTLKLKDNLKWHDGEQITADDVIFTFNCNQNTDNGAGYTNVVFVGDKEVKAEKVDDLTVKFTLPEVSASYYELLGKLILIPEHAFDGNTDIKSADANLTDIGSGPYKLVEFKDGESLTFEKFEDYYGDEPQIDQITFKVIPDASSQEVAFKNGEINFFAVSSDDVATEMEETDGVTLHKLAEGRVKYLAWNKYCPTWENRDAVKAVFMALNQEEIVKGAYGDSMGTTANSVFSNRNLFYDKDVKGYEQNLDEAKKLAQSSGLAGKTITLHYNTDRSYMEATALLIQEQLKEVGVEVELAGGDATAVSNAMKDPNNEYDMYLGGYIMGIDPDTFSSLFKNGAAYNYMHYSGYDTIDQLFEEGFSEMDESARKETYAKLQAAIQDTGAFYPIISNNKILVVNNRIQGVKEAGLVPVYTFEDTSNLKIAK